MFSSAIETVPTETSLVNNVGVTPVFNKLYNRDVMHCFIKRNIFTKHCLQYFMNGIKRFQTVFYLFFFSSLQKSKMSVMIYSHTTIYRPICKVPDQLCSFSLNFGNQNRIWRKLFD